MLRKGIEAEERILRLARDQGYKTVLDIGCGESKSHAMSFSDAGMRVTTVDFLPGCDYTGDFNKLEIPGVFDIVWASHVLELQPNVNQFLTKALALVAEGGVLAVTVSPGKHEIAGGRLGMWNTGLLLYHLILAGNDCKDAIAKCYAYNISVIVPKAPIRLPALGFDDGDIDILRPYFPVPVKQGFSGKILEIHWEKSFAPPAGERKHASLDWNSSGPAPGCDPLIVPEHNTSSALPKKTASTSSRRPIATFALSNPFINSGVERYQKVLRDLYGKKVDSEAEFRAFLRGEKERPDILLMGSFCDDRRSFVSICRENGINVAFWEDGFFPHYGTLHFDPLGFCWESSLPRMIFRGCTDRQRRRAHQARKAWLRGPRHQLPPGIKEPFVFWPLQLIGDKVNELDLGLKEWRPLIRHFRTWLPPNFQLVFKEHPLSAPKDIVGIESLLSQLPNTFMAPKDADLPALLHGCNAVAGANSSVIFEARLMHFKPAFVYARSWFTNHDELFLPLKREVDRPLPRMDWVEDPTAMRTERLDQYTDWFLAQLLGRQLDPEGAERDPARFRETLWRLSYQSFMENGESIFDPESFW